MPWIAPGVHVIFADKRQEYEYLQKRLAGERVQDWKQPECAIERAMFHRETVVGDLGAVRPGPLTIEPVGE